MRLFTGIPVTDSFAKPARDLASANANVRDIRWVPGNNLHITACFIGDTDSNQLTAIRQTIRDAVRIASPVSLTLDKICLWPSREPYMVWALFAQNEVISRLFQELEVGLTGRDEKNVFKPHITLARFKPWSSYKNLDLNKIQFPLTQVANQLVLYESRLSPQGSSYYELARFPFGALTPNP